MLKKLFSLLLGKNDWAIVWKDYEDVTIKEESPFGISWNTYTCQYFIYYSPSRNRFKLKTKGWYAKHTYTYNRAVDTLNHYTKQLG